MRYAGKKRQAKMRLCGPTRRAFVEAAVLCMCCAQEFATCCHEIARGSHRDAALQERLTWLATCWLCNTGPLTDATLWPLQKQLALKWIYDRAHFDLVGFNVLRGRAPGAIVMSEIIPEICRLLDGGRNIA